jgi:cytochrome c biogenesis protein CcmG, thiol:disulfide interchange protein DsbE
MSMLQMKRAILVALLIGLTGVSALAYLASKENGEWATIVHERDATALIDFDGREARLSSLRSYPLVVHTWASWCPYCAAELMHLANLEREHQGDIYVVAINRGESLAEARTYTAALEGVENVHFLLDPSDTYYKSIGGYAMPETVFYKSRGEIFFHQRGPMSSREADTKILEMLSR